MSDKMTPQDVIDNFHSMKMYHEMEQTMRELREEHKTASRGDKMKLTNQMNKLSETMINFKETFTYVRHISPTRVIERVVGKLQKIQEDYKKALNQFIERAQDNPEDAISWKGNYVVAMQQQSYYAGILINAMNEQETDEARVDEYIRYYNHIKEDITRQVMSNARRGSSRSTSQFHNVVELSKMEGMSEFLDDWQLGEVEYYLDVVNNYKILTGAGLLIEESNEFEQLTEE